jgi:hypothetical protein
LRKVTYGDLPRCLKAPVSARGPSVLAHTGVSLYPLHHCRRSVVRGVSGRPGTATDIGRRPVVDHLTGWCAMVASSLVVAPSCWLRERLRGHLSFLLGLWRRRRTRRAVPTAESDFRYRPLHRPSGLPHDEPVQNTSAIFIAQQPGSLVGRRPCRRLGWRRSEAAGGNRT